MDAGPQMPRRDAYIVRVQHERAERFQLWESGATGAILASLPVSQDPQRDVLLLGRVARDLGYDVVAGPN